MSKFKIKYKVSYTDRISFKIVKVSNCSDKTHCECKFKIWADRKYKNANSVDIITLEQIHIEKSVGPMFDNLFGDIFGINVKL